IDAHPWAFWRTLAERCMMPRSLPARFVVIPVSSTIGTLFRELVDGRSTTEAYMLNEGDVGLLRSLDKLSSAEASSTPTGRVSVAAHVDHVRYSLHRLNGWAS